jgi:hypothetical protein
MPRSLTPTGAVRARAGLVHWSWRGGHLPQRDLKLALTRSDKLMIFVLWILAVILVVSGIVALVRGQALWGIVLIVVGLLVGPGGVSIFTK